MVRILFALHIGLAVTLVFVPLFDGLGFERAFATGLLASITSPILTIGLVRQAQRTRTLGLDHVARRALLLNAACLLPSLAAGALAEAVRQSCEPDIGIVFLLLVAGGNVVFGTALGCVAALVPWRRGAAHALVGLVLVSALIGVVMRFYSDPQIFFYSSPWGFWPGSLYDEALSVDVRLWAFRGYSSLFAATLLAGAFAFSNEQSQFQARPRSGRLVAAVLLGSATIWAYVEGREIGWNADRASVEAALRAVVETEHFVIHVDPTVHPDRLERIAEDHEHRYAQLKEFFQTEPDDKISSYIYRDRNQKAELIGARGTQLARPWNREIHINGFQVPHRILKHELAHVFAGARARGPFKVPASNLLFVNIGVVEGIAVAADWRVNELTVHGWTKAMDGLGLMPDLRRSLDVFGFWSINSARAYTAAGSFLRYLVDTYGIEKFWTLYATNSFAQAYDRPLDDLVTEWETFLETIPLPKDDLLVAEHRFKRPSIFEKVCAHVSATTARRGYERLYAGDLEGARADLEIIYGYSPADPSPLVALAEAYGRFGRYDEARALIDRALDAPGATLKGQTQVIEARGNLAWRQQRYARALEEYSTVYKRHLSTASDRLQQARMLALTQTSSLSPPVLPDVLLGDAPSTHNFVRLAESNLKYPDNGLVKYLYARALERGGVYSEGAEVAAQAADADLTGDPLETEADLTYGRLLWWAGRPVEAEAIFRTLAQQHRSPAIRAIAADWADRARFSALRAPAE